MAYILHSAILVATTYNRMWYAVPLVVVISLVYAATRHENAGPILEHAVRFGGWIIGFMLMVFVVLFLFSNWL